MAGRETEGDRASISGVGQQFREGGRKGERGLTFRTGVLRPPRCRRRRRLLLERLVRRAPAEHVGLEEKRSRREPEGAPRKPKKHSFTAKRVSSQRDKGEALSLFLLARYFAPFLFSTPRLCPRWDRSSFSLQFRPSCSDLAPFDSDGLFLIPLSLSLSFSLSLHLSSSRFILFGSPSHFFRIFPFDPSHSASRLATISLFRLTKLHQHPYRFGTVPSARSFTLDISIRREDRR